MRTAIPSAYLLTLGCQVVCWSFYFSLLKLQWLERFRREEPQACDEKEQGWTRREAA
jgi:hypothetical protein